MKRRASTSAAKQPPRKKQKKTPKSLAFQAPVTSSPEKKNMDQNNTVAQATTLTDDWVVSTTNLLNGATQGAGNNQRIGRKVIMKTLQLSWSAQLDPTSTLGCNLRVRVVYDKQANGATFPITNYLVADSFYSPQNLSFADRFVTLYDEILDPLSTQNNFCVSGKVYRKINLETMYSGTTATIADISTGSVFLIFSQNNNAATAPPTYKYYSRIRYIDN